MKRRIIQIAGLVAAAGCVVAGIMTGEVKTVFAKAIRICLECIGLGAFALVIMAGVAMADPEVAHADEQKVVVCDDVSCMQVKVSAPDSLSIKKGKKKTLSISFDKTVESKISYKSSDKAKVTIGKNGKISAKKKGTATITTIVNCTGGKNKLKFKTRVTVE